MHEVKTFAGSATVGTAATTIFTLEDASRFMAMAVSITNSGTHTAGTANIEFQAGPGSPWRTLAAPTSATYFVPIVVGTPSNLAAAGNASFMVNTYAAYAVRLTMSATAQTTVSYVGNATQNVTGYPFVVS